jgi:hypothetical protein
VEEVTVGVEQHLIFPAFAVNQGLNFLGVLSLVNRHSNKAHACLFLPVGVNLMYGFELAVARLAPGSEEADNKGFAIVAECSGVNRFTVNIFELNRRELSEAAQRNETAY